MNRSGSQGIRQLIVPHQLSPSGLLPPVVWFDPSDAVWYCITCDVMLCHVTVGQYVWVMPTTTTPLHGSGCLHVVATTRTLSPRPGRGNCESPPGNLLHHMAPGATTRSPLLPGKHCMKHLWCCRATLVSVLHPRLSHSTHLAVNNCNSSCCSFLPRRGGWRSGNRPGTIYH